MIDAGTKRSMAMALLCGAIALIWACGGDGDGNGNTVDAGNDLPACDINRSGITYPTQLSDGESTMRPTQVFFEAVDFANETAVLRNATPEAITFDDLLQKARCEMLEPGDPANYTITDTSVAGSAHE